MALSDIFAAVAGRRVAATVDPLEMLDSAADLVNPTKVGPQLPWFAGEFLKITLGRSAIALDDKDPRFADATWRTNPVFRRLGQGYRLFEEMIDRLVEGSADGWERRARTRYLANIITGALSPTNFLWTNPRALKRAFETHGGSVLRGGQNMLRDLVRDGMPSMVDSRPFPVGEKLACTPGAVVFRDEMFELLQYTPTTPTVRRRPLVMVPPELNRHYVLDLAPGRSLVEFTVEQGVQTFMIVWRNPRADLGHGQWGLDDYLAAMARAREVAREITRSEDVNWLGLCAGGVTSALLLGHLAANGDVSVNAATFIVTILDNRYPNIVGMMDTDTSRSMLKRAAAAGKVFKGDLVRRGFAWLRPNDLVFNYLVSGWLLGEDPPAFDVLAWNHDATALSARFSFETTELLADGRAVEPGGATVLGTPIDLSKVDCDSFHVAGYTDHITPWRQCYMTSQTMGGDSEMVVVESGHIQSFVTPLESSRYDYWAGPAPDSDPDEWIGKARKHKGSWWPHWASWLIARSGEERPARRALGSRKHPRLGPAPGTYVHE